MWPNVSAPASPHSGASGIAPMPAPSRTISRTRLKGNDVGIKCSLFRSVVSIAGADLCFVFQAAHFEFDRTKLSIASFVGRIVTETVERADISRHACERRTCIGESRRFKTSTTGRAREIIHLFAGEIVERAADRHPFKRAHLAEAVEILCLRFREEELAVALNLSLRKRELAVVLTVFHEPIFDEVFRVHLDEVTSDTGARELHLRSREIGVAGRIHTVSQRNDGATTTHIILGRSAENAIGDFLETVVIRRALARAEIVDRRAQRFA